MTAAPGTRVAAIVPAHDEEVIIARTVRALAAMGLVSEIVVMADGCTDGTAGAAASAGARVLVRNPRDGRGERGPMGKGGSVEAALDRLGPVDVYLLVDADVGASATGAAPLLEAVLYGRLDVAVARFPKMRGGGFGLVKAVARQLIRAACGFTAAEPLSGQRAIRADALEACRPLATGFGLETAMAIDAVRLGFCVGEVAVDMRHRPTGRGLAGFRHRAKQGVQSVRAAVPRLLRVR